MKRGGTHALRRRGTPDCRCAGEGLRHQPEHLARAVATACPNVFLQHFDRQGGLKTNEVAFRRGARDAESLLDVPGGDFPAGKQVAGERQKVVDRVGTAGLRMAVQGECGGCQSLLPARSITSAALAIALEVGNCL